MNQNLVYYEDQYIKELETSVLKVDGQKVWVEENIFFPKTLGELSDIGELSGEKVVEVEKTDDGIAITLENNPFKIGEKVRQIFDWEYRYNGIKLHSVLHLVAGLSEKENNFRAVAGNVYSDKAVLTFKNSVPEMAVFALEDLANKTIKDGVEIKTYFDVKRKGFRWCKIGDLVPIPCGGLHVKNTSEIGSITLKSSGNKIEINI